MLFVADPGMSVYNHVYVVNNLNKIRIITIIAAEERVKGKAIDPFEFFGSHYLGNRLSLKLLDKLDSTRFQL